MRRFLQVAGLLVAAGLSACAGSGGQSAIPELQITGLEFQNRTQRFISATRLLVPATGGFVSCGAMGPGAFCASTFPERAYSGNPVEVTWSSTGQIHSTGLLQVLPSESVIEAGRARVRVVILGDGLAAIELLPEPGSP